MSGRKRPKDMQDRKAILKMVPKGTARIKVRTPEGKGKWKALDRLGDYDEIILKTNGKPCCMKQPPGRRMEARTEPVNPQVKELIRQRQEHIEKDGILEMAKDNPESYELLHQIVLGLGEEAASLAFERANAERQGDSTSAISIRRVNTLKAMADTWLKRMDQISSKAVDLDSAAFEAVFRFIIETMKESLQSSGAEQELIETAFAKFSKIVGGDSWGAEARNRMKNAK